MSKISELSDGGSLLPTDFLIAVRSGGNVKVQADQTEFDRIRLGDNEKIELGNNQDLQIYHDGSNSFVKDTGTGDLILSGANVRINNPSTFENHLYAAANGAVYLYYDNAESLATTATGVDITSNVTLNSATTAPVLKLANNSNNISAGDNLGLIEFYSGDDSGGGNAIKSTISSVQPAASPVSGEMVFKTSESTGSLTERLRIKEEGITVTGSVTADTHFTSSDGNATLSTSGTGGIVYLRPNGSSTTTGQVTVDSSGTATMDGLDVSGGAKLSSNSAEGVQLGGDAAGSTLIGNLKNTSGRFTLQAPTGRRVAIQTNGATDRMLVDYNGDISFYEDQGVTPKFFWDASAESLGIGTDSPTSQLSLSAGTGATNGITMQASGWNSIARAGINGTSGGGYILSTNWNAATNTVDSASQATTAIIQDAVSGSIQLRTGTTNTVPAEAMRLDSAGALLLHPNNITRGLKITSGTTEAVGSDTTYDTVAAGYGKHIFKTDGSERMRLDSSGNVGIGTDSPAQKLHIYDATAANQAVRLGNPVQAGTYGEIQYDPSGYEHLYIKAKGTTAGFGNIVFQTGGTPTTALTIDSSGNLLVGKSNSSFSTVGCEFRSDGTTILGRDNGNPLNLNRTSSDGSILDLRRDNTVIGSMTSDSGAHLVIKGAGNNAALLFNHASSRIEPYSDAVTDLGRANARLKDLYLSGGVYLGGTAAANQMSDYEEGTWSPVYAPTSGTFATMTMSTPDCTYTKVGRMVTVSGIIRTTDVDVTGASGAVIITGLPFAVGSWSAISLGRVQGFGGDMPDSGYGGSAANINLYYRASSNGATSALTVSDLQDGTVSSANYIFLEYTYQTT